MRKCTEEGTRENFFWPTGVKTTYRIPDNREAAGVKVPKISFFENNLDTHLGDWYSSSLPVDTSPPSGGDAERILKVA